MSHPSPNELESLVHEAEEASGAGYEAVMGGAAAPAGRPAQDQPRAKRTSCAFAGDVDMPHTASESYGRWSLWRDHVSATFWAFLSDDAAAKKAGEYHVELMHRGLEQGVDVATARAAPSVEPHEALLMMGLYESHARWKLDVVAGEWRHMNPPAQAAPQVRRRVAKARRPLIPFGLRSLYLRPDWHNCGAPQSRNYPWASCSTLRTRSCTTHGNANWWRRSSFF